MLSERERRRLHEIETGLRLTDPALVRRFAALGQARRGRPSVRGGMSVHRSGPAPSVLLGVALLVLLVGAVAVSVPVVVAGIVLAAVALGAAATTAPQARPGPA